MAAAAAARFIVGVDLGTTNTAVAAVDTAAAEPRVELFEILQLVAPGAVDRRRQLPSFIFLPDEHDLSEAATQLPWDPQARRVVGELARAQGLRRPDGMIASAKSWLCHGGVDRRAPILPWSSEAGPRLSPVEASARVLGHVRDAWDHARADRADAAPAPFIEQEIVLTVPASFDEAARELTVEAAQAAGLRHVVLLEEPQAAFCAWLQAQAEPGAHPLSPGERVLVFDVGGGTTDFTLISVDQAGELERTAVGDHLLLGGDNVDLALAKAVEERMTAGARGGRRLDALEWQGLVHACRVAKETLLSDDGASAVPLTVAGRGTRLIGNTLRGELTRAELDAILLGGFFPLVGRDELPQRQRGGLQEFGLPYARDAAITRHLAAFLRSHGGSRVDAVLFNGGAMTPPALRRRVRELIGSWQPDVGPPRELEARHPELAVATGAAWYGLGRRGLGRRIKGGSPRAFYVGVGHEGGRDVAVCIAPRGVGEGQSIELAHDFTLLTNRPTRFKLFSSTTRDDAAGAVIALPRAGGGADDSDVAATDLVELPPIVTALEAPGRAEVTVHLEIVLTVLGILEIWCREPGAPGAAVAASAARAGGGAGGGPWRLSLDMRARSDAEGATTAAPGPLGPSPSTAAETTAAGAAAERGSRVAAAVALVAAVFDEKPDALAGVTKQLEELLGLPRNEWPTEVARALFDAVLAVEARRKRSPEHEARWLQLAGFCLRPGTGAPLDDWRARSLWSIFAGDVIHQNAEQCRIAWWIAWRRVAGGLGKDEQEQINERLVRLFVPQSKPGKKLHPFKAANLLSKQRAGSRAGTAEDAEMLRCLASLERLPIPAKVALGDELGRRLSMRNLPAPPTVALYLWALGRIGARAPLYGPLDAVVPPQTAATWLRGILGRDWPDRPAIAFSVAQLARRTGDRSRDVDDDVRTEVAGWLAAAGADREATLVTDVVILDVPEQVMAFGDTLPAGLRLGPARD